MYNIAGSHTNILYIYISIYTTAHSLRVSITLHFEIFPLYQTYAY